MRWAAQIILFFSVFIRSPKFANSVDNKRRQTRHATEADARERLRSFLDQKVGKAEFTEPVAVNSDKVGGARTAGVSAYAPTKPFDEIEVKTVPTSPQNSLSQMRSIVSDVSPVQDKRDDSVGTLESNGDVCSPCPSESGVAFTSLSLTKFWENDIASANGCSCMALQLRKDDPIALAVYAATSKQAGGANTNFDAGGFSSKTAPSVLRDWEVLAPFPPGQSHFDAGKIYHLCCLMYYSVLIVSLYRSIVAAS
jgi:hypothetical protein